jgi:hypothetical protein
MVTTTSRRNRGWHTAMLGTGLLVALGLLTAGLPGIALFEGIISLLFGLSALDNDRFSPDRIWPIGIYISLLWPLGVPVSYLMSGHLLRRQRWAVQVVTFLTVLLGWVVLLCLTFYVTDRTS